MNLAEYTAKILIVDNMPANLRLLSQILSANGCHVRAVTSGERALASVQADLPDLVLLDIRMPGMDGYQVCRRLKEDPQTRGIPVLFISALDEIEDKVKAFAAGGQDYITKPFQMEEVIARVETHLTLWRLQNSLQEANRRMERELVLAGQVQASMMRKHLPEMPGWQMAVRLLWAKLTCGDFFDAFTLPDGRAALLIADVVDKGVGAALSMSVACTLLRTAILENPGHPDQVFTWVNRRLLEDMDADQFITVFLGILDPETGEMVYSGAGHNPPLLVRGRPGQAVDLIRPTGPVLGILEEASWQAGRLCMAPGDVLVMYTDGITEAENEQRDFWGEAPLVDAAQEAVGRSPEEICEAILGRLMEFRGSAPQFDDMALLVVKMEG